MKKLLILLTLFSFCFANQKFNNVDRYSTIVKDKSIYEIDEGYGFFVKGSIDSLADKVSANFYFDPSSANCKTEINLDFEIETEAETTILLYINPTVTGGTLVTINNRNLILNNQSEVKTYKDVTITSLGTLVSSYKTGSGKKAGGTALTGRKFLSDCNYRILIVVENDTNSDNWIDYVFNWFENGRK